MTDAAADDSGPVFRLTYHSRSRISATERKYQLGEIFSVARSTNKKIGVTGAMLITDDEFVQTLEGPEQVVRELYAKFSGTNGTNMSSCLRMGRSPSGCSASGRWPGWPLMASRIFRCSLTWTRAGSARRSLGPPPRRRTLSWTSCARRCVTPPRPPLSEERPPATVHRGR